MVNHSIPAKACKDCGVVMPVVEFPPYSGKRGYRTRCKSCFNRREAALRQERRSADPAFYERELLHNKKYRERYSEGYRQHRIRKRQKHIDEYFTDLTYRCKTLIAGAKRRADKKGLPFELDAGTLEAIIKVQNFKCSITGMVFDLAQSDRYARSPLAPSIDRKNSDAGYTWDNVQIVVAWYNIFKNEWTDDDAKRFIEVAYRTIFKD